MRVDPPNRFARIGLRFFLCGFLLFGVLAMHALPIGGHAADSIPAHVIASPTETVPGADHPGWTPPDPRSSAIHAVPEPSATAPLEDNGAGAHTMLHMCLAVLAAVAALGAAAVVRARVPRRRVPSKIARRGPPVLEPPPWVMPTVHTLGVLRL